jgi:hypothetical protein
MRSTSGLRVDLMGRSKALSLSLLPLISLDTCTYPSFVGFDVRVPSSQLKSSRIGTRTSLVRERGEQLIRRERKVANTNTSRMVNSIGNCGCSTNDANLANTFGTDRVYVGINLINPLDRDSSHIGIFIYSGTSIVEVLRNIVHALLFFVFPLIAIYSKRLQTVIEPYDYL